MCPSCNEEVKITDRFKENILKMKMSNPYLWVFCEDHDDIIGEFFSKSKQRVICSKCAITSSNTKEDIVELKKEEFDQYLQFSLEKMDELRN